MNIDQDPINVVAVVHICLTVERSLTVAAAGRRLTAAPPNLWLISEIPVTVCTEQKFYVRIVRDILAMYFLTVPPRQDSDIVLILFR